MQFKTVIKWLHCALTVCLLVLIMGYCWLERSGDNRAGDTLQRVSKVNDHTWLYMTKNQNGGATVPTVYRYYLAEEIKGSDSEIVKTLAEGFPFISGSGTISDIQVGADKRVKVIYSGRVFSLNNEVSYKFNGQDTTATISYDIN